MARVQAVRMFHGEDWPKVRLQLCMHPMDYVATCNSHGRNSRGGSLVRNSQRTLAGLTGLRKMGTHGSSVELDEEGELISDPSTVQGHSHCACAFVKDVSLRQ